MGDLLKNVERSMYVFNLNNIVDICHQKVIMNQTGQAGQTKLNQEEKILLDNCIDKYMQAFGVVKEETLSHLTDIIKN